MNPLPAGTIPLKQRQSPHAHRTPISATAAPKPPRVRVTPEDLEKVRRQAPTPSAPRCSAAPQIRSPAELTPSVAFLRESTAQTATFTETVIT